MIDSVTIHRAGLVCLFLSLSPRAHASELCDPAQSLPRIAAITAGSGPHGIVVGDWNSDGLPDVAVANSSPPSSLTVHLATAPGSFSAGVSLTAPGNPYHVLTADFDVDGHLDLVTANYNSSVITYFRGTGTGSFESGVNYAAGTNPSYARAADFNGDGRPDLAVLNLTNGSVSILRSIASGPGLFSAPLSISLGNSTSYPATLETADFTQDGVLDLAVVLYGRNQVALLKGSGVGGFGPPSYVSVGIQPWNIEAHDFDLDGILDLAVSSRSGLGILRGTGQAFPLGAGTFTAAIHYSAPVYPQGMVFADFTRDGILDAVLGLADRTSLVIYPGTGMNGIADGSFASAREISTSSFPFALDSGEFTGDGNEDLVAACYQSNVFALHVNTCASPCPMPAPPLPGSSVGEWPLLGQPLSTATGDQTQARAVSDGGGGAIIAWRDTREASRVEIYVTRVDRHGHPVEGWDPVGTRIASAPADRQYPAIVTDGAGGAFVGWLDTRDGSSTIYAQRILASGAIAPGWPVNGMRVASTGPQITMTMDSDGLGGAVFAAQDRRHTPYRAVYAFRVSGNGTYPSGWSAIGRAVVVFSSDVGSLTEITAGPFVVGNGSGDAFIVIHYSRAPGPDFDPAVHNSALYRISSNDLRGVYGRSQQTAMLPFCGSNGSGGVVFGVTSTATDVLNFDSEGNPLWSASLPTARSYDVCPDGMGGMLLFSTSLTNPRIISAFRIGPSGVLHEGWNGNGLVIATGTGHRAIEGLAPDGDGGCFVAWADERNGRNDLFGLHLTGEGAAAPGWNVNGDILCAPTGVREPSSLFSDPEAAIVVWPDSRNGCRDLFGQRLTADLPVPTLASLVSQSATPEGVELFWFTPDGAGREFEMDRRTPATEWSMLGSANADGSGLIHYEDRAVEPGQRYGYRILRIGEIPVQYSNEAWIEVPSRWTFDLEPMRPNPVDGDLSVNFTIPTSGNARLDLLDVSGRAVLSKEFRALFPGRHSFQLSDRESLVPGIYLVRLTHRDLVRVAKVAIIR